MRHCFNIIFRKKKLLHYICIIIELISIPNRNNVALYFQFFLLLKTKKYEKASGLQKKKPLLMKIFHYKYE